MVILNLIEEVDLVGRGDIKYLRENWKIKLIVICIGIMRISLVY